MGQSDEVLLVGTGDRNRDPKVWRLRENVLQLLVDGIPLPLPLP